MAWGLPVRRPRGFAPTYLEGKKKGSQNQFSLQKGLSAKPAP